jgi:predicted metal-dependent hydrolase
MPIIIDEEFGMITLRRSARASHVRIKVAPDGRLRASLPLYAPIFLVKRLLKNSRSELREMLAEQHNETVYEHGMTIGKSHSLIVRPTKVKAVTATRHGQQIIVSLPDGKLMNDPSASRIIRDTVIEALRIEAKSYLPKRLAFLAEKYGFSYEKVRSNGTISLNIALMKLPFELIDYVIIHELSHTVQLNHSDQFWELVQKGDPQYIIHRRTLKNENPSI